MPWTSLLDIEQDKAWIQLRQMILSKKRDLTAQPPPLLPRVSLAIVFQFAVQEPVAQQRFDSHVVHVPSRLTCSCLPRFVRAFPSSHLMFIR